MTLVKFNNRPISRTIDSVFDDLFTSFPAVWNEGVHNPPVNIHETKEGYHVELNAPGLKKEDFTVNVDNGLLTIGFEKKEEKQSEEYKTIRREFSSRSFKRSFNLDDSINVELVEAKYDNGILKLYLPKKEQAKAGSRQIQIG